MRVLVAGAGIGGLTAAIALGRAGHDVVLVERAASFEAVGAGLVLGPNAAAALSALGVELGEVAARLPALDVVNARGRLLQRVDTAAMAARVGPTWALSRPELHDLLHRALPGTVDVHLGTTLVGLHDVGGAPVTVALERDGVRGDEDVDLVVAADGLRSVTRGLLHLDVPYRYSGVTCYRGIVDNPGFEHGVEAWGDPARIGAIPLGGGRLYYFLVLTAPEGAAPLDFPDGFVRSFGHLGGGIERVLAVILATGAPPPLHHDLVELDRPVWGRGRVLLLGDAAHSMTPNQGQGAAMAIEDAVELARLVGDGLGTDVSTLVDRYRDARDRRVRRVQLDSRRVGAMAHRPRPFERAAVHALMRATPRALSHVAYRRMVEAFTVPRPADRPSPPARPPAPFGGR